MAGKPISEIRNIAFIGNAASGKTTLVEQLLLRTGAINNAGTVEQGNTVCDFDPMEKASGHSLEPALCHSTYNDIELHIVDTPGYPELHGRSLSVLTAVESAFIVVAANAGLDTATERLYQAARDRGLDCFLVINKIDGHASSSGSVSIVYRLICRRMAASKSSIATSRQKKSRPMLAMSTPRMRRSSTRLSSSMKR